MNLFVWYIFHIIVLKFGSGLLPEYCHFPANISDCGKPPTAIFSYYKPGARCEIEFWRGCPTLNKFDDQYECSEHCVVQPSMDGISISEAHHIRWSQDYVEYGRDRPGVFSQLKKIKGIKGPGTAEASEESRESGGSGELNMLPASCREDLNTSQCSAKSELVYTYSTESGECYETKWYHCLPSDNKFNTAEDCVRLCLHAQVDWEYELAYLQKDEAEELDHAIEDVIKDFSKGHKDSAEDNNGNIKGHTADNKSGADGHKVKIDNNKGDALSNMDNTDIKNNDSHKNHSGDSNNGDPKDNTDNHKDTQAMEIKEATEIEKAIVDAASQISDNNNSQSPVSGEDRLSVNEINFTQILFATTHEPVEPLKQIVYATRAPNFSIRLSRLDLGRQSQFLHRYRR